MRINPENQIEPKNPYSNFRRGIISWRTESGKNYQFGHGQFEGKRQELSGR